MSKRKGDPGYAPGWCIHYVGPPGFYDRDKRHVCDAGIDMETYHGVTVNARPCFLDVNKSRPGAVACAHLRVPTPDEISAHEAWVVSRLDRLGIVLRAVAPWRATNKGRSHAEAIECPLCQGKLHLSISAHNGHVHGECETPDCISWTE
jgi:hypothetical protein